MPIPPSPRPSVPLIPPRTPPHPLRVTLVLTRFPRLLHDPVCAPPRRFMPLCAPFPCPPMSPYATTVIQTPPYPIHTHPRLSLSHSSHHAFWGNFPGHAWTHHARVRPSVRFFVSFLCASVSPHSTPLSRTHPRPYMTFFVHLTVYFDTLHVLYILDCCTSTVYMCRILRVRIIFMY